MLPHPDAFSPDPIVITRPRSAESVDGTAARRLPELITINHGPHRLLGRYFLKADAEAQACGVRLYLHQDLRGLVEANERLQAQWAPLVPIFNPGRSAVRPDAGFWIEGRNEAGDTVATQAARFLPWFETSLQQELSSLRLFYEDPITQAGTGEKAEVTAPSASRISGRVIFSGGGWYRRDFRGVGLSTILPRLSRVYAYTRFRSDFTFSLVEPALVEKGVTARYGYRRSEAMVRFTGSFRGDLDFHLVWMSSDELLDELHDHMVSSTTARDLTMDTVETRVRPPHFQGSKSLS